MEPDLSGGHWLHVNKAMRKGAGADVGDTVRLAILGPEPEPTLSPDFRAALTASHDAHTLWKDLTLMGRLDWIRWIEAARKSETRPSDQTGCRTAFLRGSACLLRECL